MFTFCHWTIDDLSQLLSLSLSLSLLHMVMVEKEAIEDGSRVLAVLPHPGKESTYWR